MTYFTQSTIDKVWRYGAEYFNIGSVPCGERCTQAGENPHAQKLECLALTGQLERLYGKHKDCDLVMLRCEHEFGSYYELCALFKEDNEEALAHAQKMELLPEKWDAQAIQFLEQYEHPSFVTKVIPLKQTA